MIMIVSNDTCNNSSNYIYDNIKTIIIVTFLSFIMIMNYCVDLNNDDEMMITFDSLVSGMNWSELNQLNLLLFHPFRLLIITIQ